MVGTRIDGVILGIQAGVPSLCIVHDSRTRELCETLKVPFVMGGKVIRGIAREDLPGLIQFDAEEFDANRRRMAGILNRFLQDNGLPASKWLASIDGKTASSSPPVNPLLENTLAVVRDLAARGGNHRAIAAAWATLRDRCPDERLAYTSGAAALRAAGDIALAETLAEDAMRRFPNDPVAASEHARAAFERRDLPLAVARWEAVCERFPDYPPGHAGLAQSLRVGQRYEEAERVAHAALSRHPDSPSLAIEYARGAFHRRDFEEAISRWAAIRERFPSAHEGYTSGVQCLRLANRLAEAESLAEVTISRFPNIIDAWSEYALLADARQDWQESVRRWQEPQRRFPQHPAGFLYGAHALRLAKRIDEADELLVNAHVKFPENSPLFVEYVRCATDRDDQGEVARRSQLLRGRFPNIAT